MQAQQPDVVCQTEPRHKRQQNIEDNSNRGSSRKPPKPQPAAAKSLNFTDAAAANKKEDSAPTSVAKYRCDENVLQAAGKSKEQFIALPPDESADLVYSTGELV